jgi:hypothetical protein
MSLYTFWFWVVATYLFLVLLCLWVIGVLPAPQPPAIS